MEKALATKYNSAAKCGNLALRYRCWWQFSITIIYYITYCRN